jgi:hypothetical protein
MRTGGAVRELIERSERVSGPLDGLAQQEEEVGT